MANQRYLRANQAFLEGEIAWTTDPIHVLLVSTTAYTFSKYHAWLADIPASARIAMSGTLENRTATNGIADADDILVTGLDSQAFHAFVLVKSTGNEATSALISFNDKGLGIPMSPNGNAAFITWSNDEDKIMRL